MSTDVTAQYPARYYASYDPTASEPAPVMGWYDVWGMSDTTAVPEASTMIALSVEQWEARLPFGQAVQGGTIIAYTPASTETLAQQAAAAYTQGAATVWSEYGVLNESTPDAWVTYLKALKAIVDGTDTTSTSLPAAPTS